jgi:NAD(P)-dependent dehydrogenase (short-subunit alcohol dehydrogenase family)
MTWDIRGKTVLVTGASSGIGLEASVVLAGKGARLVLVGRDRDRTEAARAAVTRRSGSTDVETLLCDFASQRQIRRLADEFLDGHDRLDVLVNNAGAVHKTRELTEDGIERTFAVNHLGYFLLTKLLLGRLRESAPARVVSVASLGHRQGTLDFDDLGFERGYQILKAYARSKLANVLFSAELARRLAGTGVTSNCLHPGAVATNIWSGAPFWARPLIWLLMRPRFITAEQGGQTIVQLCLSPGLEGRSGRYFEEGQEAVPSRLARDEALARRLWEESARLVGLPS